MRPMLTDDTYGDGRGNVSFQYIPKLPSRNIMAIAQKRSPDEATSNLGITYSLKRDTPFYPVVPRADKKRGPLVNDIVLGLLYRHRDVAAWDNYIDTTTKVTHSQKRKFMFLSSFALFFSLVEKKKNPDKSKNRVIHSEYKNFPQ
tara:strand:- start:192 stop:626 length:435 start_codon:yes stop_codon:yes gene_type:complete